MAGQTLVSTTALTTQAYTQLSMVKLKSVAAFLQLEKKRGEKKDTLVHRIIAHLTDANAAVDIPVPIHEHAEALDAGDSGFQINAI